jgi:SH3-like domain-containing protein
MLSHRHRAFGSAITATVLLLGLLNTAVADTLTIILPRAAVRAGPSTSHEVLVTVSKDMVFSILTTDKGWHKIPLEDGREGWIADTAVRIARASRGLGVAPSPQLPAPVPVSAQIVGRRTALVIGNAAYARAPLRNPVNDAMALKTALTHMGFQDVVVFTNAKREQMLKAIADLGQKLTQGGVGLFFFAGHGLQVKGENYLVPVDASFDSDTLEDNMVPVQRVIDRLEEAKNGFNILIFDACRDNPFVSKTRSGQRGLAYMEAPIGTLVAFAASRNQTASDGDGPNGLYTTHLLKNMRIPGLPVEQMFKYVRNGVSDATGGKQVPEEWTKLHGDFFFLPLGGQGASHGGAYAPPPAVSLPAPKPTGKQGLVALQQPTGSATRPEPRQGTRIMVILLETSQGRRVPDPAGEKAMVRQLLQSGLSVVDQEHVQRIRDSEQVRKAVAGDREAVRSLGQRHGADVLIVGEASSEQALSGGVLGQLVSVRAHVDARALRMDTGDMVTTDGQSASGVDLVESGASRKALEEAAKKWVETNLPRLRQR